MHLDVARHVRARGPVFHAAMHAFTPPPPLQLQMLRPPLLLRLLPDAVVYNQFGDLKIIIIN